MAKKEIKTDLWVATQLTDCQITFSALGSDTSIMLPITDDGQPDYDFMEEFGRKMMSNKYNQYLKHLSTM